MTDGSGIAGVQRRYTCMWTSKNAYMHIVITSLRR